MPFVDWINSIKDATTRHRIRRRLDRVELGHYGEYKVLGEGVCELKLDFGPGPGYGYRIYFAEQDNVIIILLCGGDKSSQSKDIQKAKTYWRELLERNHE
ncbi:type II toxin-antitoxin system RelE/ParE family toxin [Legionella sp. CNM-1927-20]|uniref:type II toxin-antitoxin system RelE/ParE family toxin n=1 Tax=Legionella sp. CNM-1927-20 TaxID=3422221 RepID=UPI00403AD401